MITTIRKHGRSILELGVLSYALTFVACVFLAYKAGAASAIWYDDGLALKPEPPSVQVPIYGVVLACVMMVFSRSETGLWDYWIAGAMSPLVLLPGPFRWYKQWKKARQ